MAKINISFDNKNYPVDESSLSSASAALQSHLSSVMNGTGATINLGGTAYNVDSAKLTAATNAFVSHLGAVAGNGYKVKVGGVEYNVDATKMASAVADLHEVLGGLQSGGNGGSETVILAEQTLYFVEYMAQVEGETTLTIGETYRVIWDGTEYACVCSEIGGYAAIGNAYVMNEAETDTGEPFVIAPVDGATIFLVADEESTHTVAIYKASTPPIQ